MYIPEFWKTKFYEIEETLSIVKKGKVKKLCDSAGGREIMYVEYGEKQDFNRTANFNSACAARDTKYYADKTDKKPVILFLGGTHGHELEGTVAVNNLIKIIETGTDFQNNAYPYFYDIIEQNKVRLIMVPLHNPDGRARLGIDSLIGKTVEQMHYYGQGTWKDGTLCNWPGCKKIHPIKDAVDFMGAYFNDDGVNFMHDNFFNPMAEETKTILKLADKEALDFALLLHGCESGRGELLYTDYVPDFVNETIEKIGKEAKEKCAENNLKFNASDYKPLKKDYSRKSFNLTSAIFHICGGVPVVYESDQGLGEFNPENYNIILQTHYILFEKIFEHYIKN